MASRITVILHPNPTCIDVVLNDRMFNQEQYGFSRKKQAEGAEAAMLDVLNRFTIGIRKAETSKNTLKLEISDGMLPNEIVPAVITAITRFVDEADYSPVIFCDDRRRRVWPVESGDEWSSRSTGGVRYNSGEVDLGVEYTPWAQ